MLAAPVDRLPESRALPGGCAYEPKFDGYRALIYVDEDGQLLIQSRRGAVITHAFPDIADAVSEQLPPASVLDGELVVLGQSGVLEFEALQRRLGAGRQLARRLALAQPASFVAFDVLTHRGKDQRSSPFSSRRRLLERVMADCRPPLQLTPQTTATDVARRWVEQYTTTAVGLEGVVAKGLDQRYEPGRRGWLKYRVRNTHEVVLGAVTGNFASPGRLVLGRYDAEGKLVVVGGTGDLKPAQARMLNGLLTEPSNGHPWPTELPAGRMGHFGGGPLPVTLVEPLVVEVSADQSFEHHKWRHIVRFVRPRPDLTIDEVPSIASRTQATAPTGDERDE